MSGLTMTAEVTIAGQKVPFPVQFLVQAFGAQGEPVANSFDCHRDTLKLKPQVEGAKTSWQILERVK